MMRREGIFLGGGRGGVRMKPSELPRGLLTEKTGKAKVASSHFDLKVNPQDPTTLRSALSPTRASRNSSPEWPMLIPKGDHIRGGIFLTLSLRRPPSPSARSYKIPPPPPPPHPPFRGDGFWRGAAFLAAAPEFTAGKRQHRRQALPRRSTSDPLNPENPLHSSLFSSTFGFSQASP